MVFLTKWAGQSHDISYGNFKYYLRRTDSDKSLHDKAFNIAKMLSMMNISVGLNHWFVDVSIKTPMWRFKIHLLVHLLTQWQELILKSSNYQKNT